MGGALNLFVLLNQAADRFGDRGAVYLGEQQLLTWAEPIAAVLASVGTVS